ncbi:TBC1 domain family member 2A [Bombina bombina]|uniref:TBC1 domain family member 2A n=1 Tax=Bombina bombina TaxID=8345 RepID=UPI00235AC424|nr:TBC1 domain family member 2A [Bombina bombina]
MEESKENNSVENSLESSLENLSEGSLGKTVEDSVKNQVECSVEEVEQTKLKNPEEYIVLEQTNISSRDQYVPMDEQAHLIPIKQDKKAEAKQLCGYLYKLGIKGPIKTWKYRFFSYDDRKCLLLYYRMAKDVSPLGSIDLSTAVFNCKVEMEKGTFEIKTPSKVFILKAINNHAMMYWLQQLQKKRRQICSMPSRLDFRIISDPPEDQLDQGNVAAEDDGFLPPVKTPTEVVGSLLVSLPAPQETASIQNISLKHPWTEIQNTVRNLCGSKPNGGGVRSVFHYDEVEQPEEKTVQEMHGLEAVLKPSVTKLPPSLNFARKARRHNGFIGQTTTETVSLEKMSSPQQQIQALTEELKSQKGLVKLLHRVLESAHQEKRACDDYMNATLEKDRLELVRHKVRQIEELKQRVEALEEEKKETDQALSLKDHHIAELEEHVKLLMEKNHAKQQVILKQKEQLLSCCDGQDVISSSSEPFKQLYKQIESLTDDIDAYKTQNQFLNSEIHQLTDLWRNTSEKEQALLMKCSYLEAKNCQLESKYLIVLRKLREALPHLDAEYCEVIKNLIEDALQSDVKQGDGQTGLQLNPISGYDDYGFMIIPEYEVEHLKLLAKIQALELRSNKLLTHDVVDKPLKMKWDNIEDLTHSVELKNLVRCGIPAEHRKRVWKWLTARRLHLSSNCYEKLLNKCETSQHPATKQIELDLHRTLTNNKHFSCPTSDFIQKLRRVLLAFSWQNPTIGYCQGLNRLAALALLVLEEEASAFYCLVDIVENIMPAEYYSNNLAGSQVDQRVFKDFLSEKLPRLTAHFQQYKIDLSMITFNWFLVVFVDSLVSDILLRVWDAFLFEGTKVIFRYALAIFKYNEEEILKITDETDIYQYLSFFTKTICDGRKLMNIAFNEMNPFPMKLLKNRRAAHLEKFKAELAELEQIKQEYVLSKKVEGKKDLDIGLSEDEEETGNNEK